MYKIDYAPPRKNPDNSILLPIRSNTWAHTYSNEGGNMIYLGNYFRPPRAPWGPLDSGLMMWTRMKVFTLLILFKRTFSATRCSIWVLTRVLAQVLTQELDPGA